MMTDKIQKLPQVIEETGLCRSSIYAGISAGTFPKQVKLGLRSVGWLKSEIMIWLSEKVRARDEINTTTINHK
jgi:prophage regulatory protein